MEKTVAIIGSGLGGLECACILARKGFKVIVLEKENVPGGALQTFSRRDNAGRTHTFDTGFHYVGSLGEGEPLNRLFSYFGLMDLPWEPLDEDFSAEVVRNGRHFALPSGYEAYGEYLSGAFPQCREGIRKYVEMLKDVGDNIFNAFRPESGMNPLFGISAADYLRETLRDQELVTLVSGASAFNMDLRPESLSLYVFAQINSSFIRSSWRLGRIGGQMEGGAAVAGTLISSLEREGGELVTGAEVTAIRTDGIGRAISLDVRKGNDNFELPVDYVISDLHPALTVGMVDECKALRRIYRSRMTGLGNTRGMFTVNVALKPGTIPYLNRNVFASVPGCDPWRPSGRGGDIVMVHFNAGDVSEGYACSLDILTPMDWGEVALISRGEAYRDMKRQCAERCIELASRVLPGLEDAVDKYWTGTPLTWRDYTGTVNGAAFGAFKDCRNPLATVLSPRTPLENLFLTGQSLNLHGILGVSMTSVLTCSAMPGLGDLSSEILAND
ncbi:MAG: phytoene desaturase family protein [Candidatus Cryptobacteroides sp.]